MFGLGVPELLIVLVLVVVLFGSNKLPKLARSLGETHKEIRRATASVDGENDKNA
jgi:sec-independent protein translocase protein TatA